MPYLLKQRHLFFKNGCYSNGYDDMTFFSEKVQKNFACKKKVSRETVISS